MVKVPESITSRGIRKQKNQTCTFDFQKIGIDEFRLKNRPNVMNRNPE